MQTNFYSMTPQVTTGNVRTTMDKYDTTQLNNGAKNPLGAVYFDSNGVKYRYVQYNSSGNATAVLAYPGVVYWVDALRTQVTALYSEALTAKVNSVAGYMMINSTDVSTLTAALLNTNYIWIAVAGYVKGAASVASTVADDILIGSTTGFVPARIASGSAILNVPVAIAQTAVSSNKSDVWVCVESL